MITVHTVAYNEEVFVKFMIDHYRKRFPTCHIVIHDNYSSDKTVEIAKANGAEVQYFDTCGYFSDTANVTIKNNAWKNDKTDWVLCCDMDELLDITEEQLKQEEALGTTIVKSRGYAMVNMEDNYDLENIKYGAYSPPYGKDYLFNKKFIKEIRYVHGCHKTNPIGKVQYSKTEYKGLHFKNVNADLLVKRVKEFGARLSPENLKHGWGRHYLLTEENIREDFRVARLDVTKIID